MLNRIRSQKPFLILSILVLSLIITKFTLFCQRETRLAYLERVRQRYLIGSTPNGTTLQSHLRPIPPTRKKQSYLMALSYHEQLFSALRHEVLSLATLAADWELSLVEPLLVDSRPYGLLTFLPEVDRPRASDALYLMDLLALNSVLHECAGISMARYTQVFSDPPSQVVLMYGIPNNHPPREVHTSLDTDNLLRNRLYHSLDNSGIIECSNVFYYEETELINGIESALMAESKRFNARNRKMEITKVICFDYKSIVYSDQFMTHLKGEEGPRLFIFLTWRGCSMNDCSIGSFDRQPLKEEGYRDMDSRFQVITKSSLSNFVYCSTRPIQHSADVAALSRSFLQLCNLTQPYLSVHIRAERLIKGIGLASDTETIRCCLDKLKATVDDVLESHPNHQLLVVMDTGVTDTCGTAYHCATSMNFIYSLITQEYKWLPCRYHPTGGEGTPRNGGLFSLVEMGGLAKGEFLFLLGGGNFQMQLHALFLTTPSNDKVFDLECNQFCK